MVQFSEKGPLLGVVDSFQIHPSNGQDGGNMSKIAISDLKDFCRTVLQKEGMKNEYATNVADVLSETDAFVYTLTEQKICLGIFKKSVLEESIFMLNRRSYSMRLLLQR